MRPALSLLARPSMFGRFSLFHACKRLPAIGRYLLLCLYLCLWLFALFNYSSRCQFSQPDIFSTDWAASDPRHESGLCYLHRDQLGLQYPNLMKAPELRSLEHELSGPGAPAELRVKPGGSWAPSNCTPLQHVAVMIAFRNRHFHLRLLLDRLHRMLPKQKLRYTLFVVEQGGTEPFNRGMLMNVGVMEAMKLASFDCFIFHDVDMIPEHDQNVYLCDENARHMASAIDEMRYHVMFYNYLGAVLAMSSKNYFRINGFSNVYWGWGNEDDDISARTMEAGMLVSRPPATLGRYKMVRHPKSVRIEGGNEFFMAWRKRHYEDGLNSLTKDSYTVLGRQTEALYTNITVRLSRSRHSMTEEWLSQQESVWWFLKFYYP